MATADPSDAPLTLRHAFVVQGYDIDVAGIVNNIVYIRWLEDLRQRFCDTYYPTARMLAQGFLPALGSTQIHYRRAIRYGESVEGLIRFDGFRGQRWRFTFTIHSHGLLAAEAQQEGVFLNLADGSLHPIPADMAQSFGKRRIESEFPRQS